jgi:hypothetical protein
LGCVYLITSPSGKQYVGQTVRSLEARWREHRYEAVRGSKLLFHQAIRKYGADKFACEVLHDGIEGIDELNRLEAEEIAARDTLSPGGYNLTTGGDSSLLADEVLRVLSRKSKFWNEAQHPNIFVEGIVFPSAASADRHFDITTTLTRCKSRLKRYCGWFKIPNHGVSDLDAQEKQSAIERWRKALREIPEDCVSNETRIKLSKSIKAAHARPEVKVLRQAVFSTPEVKSRWNSGMDPIWNDPEIRKKRRTAQKVAFSKPEFVARLKKRSPTVFVEGSLFSYAPDAAEALEIPGYQIENRCRSKSRRFRWWFKIPNHNDPTCDAVEECWAQMQFAEACPDHENVPDWCRPKHCDLPEGFWA